MITFPNCKINLGLYIVSKRADGFHNLETIFYPIPLKDALEVIHDSSSPSTGVTFISSGIKVESEANICIKAYQLLKKDFPLLPPIKMHLHKVIPIGAGLGGGSADGAFTLVLLNKKFDLGIDHQQLVSYALELGSDCPFFILNQAAYATGRGEALEEVTLDFSAYKFMLVNPQIHINTGWAFSQITPSAGRMSLKEVIQLPIEQWKEKLTNDFEHAVFTKYPEVKSVKDKLYSAGAVYASMSGSGSTVYGLFKRELNSLPDFPEHYFVKIV